MKKKAYTHISVFDKTSIINNHISNLIDEINNFFLLTQKERRLLILNFENDLLLKYTTNKYKKNFGRKWKKTIKKMIANKFNQYLKRGIIKMSKKTIICDYCGVELNPDHIVKVGFSIGDNICKECYNVFVKDNDVLTKTYDLDTE
jgi:hypothetical protein